MDLDLSGRDLGGYRLLRRLGRGAMAEVYLAEQVSLRRQVAVKLLRRELATDENYVRRFHVEAQAAAALVHPSIVQIYEVGLVDGLHFIAQEYVAGQNLEEFLRRHGSPPVEQALDILHQVAAALGKAAQRGIVHRDIKPENIMLASSGEVKVADFGLARLVGQDDALSLTRIGVTMGTPLYMSPEQIEGRTLDSRSDLYSLGVTAYYLLTGRLPFSGDTALNVAVQHLRSTPPRLENVRADLPPAVCRIVHKLLAKNPESRYASPQDLQVDLEAFLPRRTVRSSTAEAAMEPVASAVSAESLPRLQALMNAAAAQRMRPSRGVLLGLLLAVGFGLGAALAYSQRTPSLLAPRQGETLELHKYPTAEAQFSFARLLRSEAAYRSVLDYFPQDQSFAPLARRELAVLYLRNHQTAEAERLLRELTEAGDRPSRASGLAGLCILALQAGKTQQADELFNQLAQLAGGRDPADLDKVLDRDLTRMLNRALKESRR